MDVECVDVSRRWKKPDKRKEDFEKGNGSHADLEISVDINDIVDKCFKEENEKEYQNNTNKEAKPKYAICTSQRQRKISNIQIKVGINEKKHSSICFTIEEEFRIHDLIAKREFMNEIFEKIKRVDSEFVKDSVVNLMNGRKINYGQKMWDESQKMGQQIGKDNFDFNMKQHIKFHFIYFQLPQNFKMYLMNFAMLIEEGPLSKLPQIL